VWLLPPRVPQSLVISAPEECSVAQAQMTRCRCCFAARQAELIPRLRTTQRAKLIRRKSQIDLLSYNSSDNLQLFEREIGGIRFA